MINHVAGLYKLETPENIKNPQDYFEQADEKETDPTLRLEKMVKGVQALLLKKENAIGTALEWVAKMPPDCLQRNYALNTIATKQAGKKDLSGALKTAGKMTDMACYIVTIQAIALSKTPKEIKQLVLKTFPNTPSEEIDAYF